jgi:hypothetical protein
MNLSAMRGRPHWSYSSLNLLLNICSLQWAFEKIEKLPKPFTPVSLAFGSAYHRAMEFIAAHRMDGTLPAEGEVRDLFHAAWERGQEEGPPLEKTDDSPDALAKLGAGLAEAYLRQVDPAERVVDYSRAFAVPVGASEKPLIGEIDCVVETAGETVLVDWKTSARRWPASQAEKSMQPTAYLYGAEQLQAGAGCSRFRFEVAIKNKTPVIDHSHTTRSPDDFLRLERMAETADRIVAHELFYPSEQSFACAGCVYAEPCRAWHRKAARTTVPLAA